MTMSKKSNEVILKLLKNKINTLKDLCIMEANTVIECMDDCETNQYVDKQKDKFKKHMDELAELQEALDEFYDWMYEEETKC